MNGHGGKKLDSDSAADRTTDDSIGEVRVTVVSGRGLKIQEELFNIDVPDVYCKIHFDSQSWTTTVKHNTITPAWNESHTFNLLDHGQIITVNAWDKNEREYDPDVEIGSAKTTVGKLLLAGGSMDLEMKKGGRPSGVHIQIRCDMVE
jgi:Ca2+-dependent lipid-binding protein